MLYGGSEPTSNYAHLRGRALFDLLPQATQQIRQAPLLLRHLLLRKLLPRQALLLRQALLPIPRPLMKISLLFLVI